MKNLLISSVTLFSFALSNTVHPDVSEAAPQTETQLTEEPAAETQQPSETEVKYVSKDSTSEKASAAKREKWMYIGLAIGTVIVATVALILVSNNNGHKK